MISEVSYNIFPNDCGLCSNYRSFTQMYKSFRLHDKLPISFREKIYFLIIFCQYWILFRNLRFMIYRSCFIFRNTKKKIGDYMLETNKFIISFVRVILHVIDIFIFRFAVTHEGTELEIIIFIRINFFNS